MSVSAAAPVWKREGGDGLNPTFSVHRLEEKAVLLAGEGSCTPRGLHGLCQAGVQGRSWDRALPGTLAVCCNISAKTVGKQDSLDTGQEKMISAELSSSQ